MSCLDIVISCCLLCEACLCHALQQVVLVSFVLLTWPIGVWKQITIIVFHANGQRDGGSKVLCLPSGKFYKSLLFCCHFGVCNWGAPMQKPLKLPPSKMKWLPNALGVHYVHQIILRKIGLIVTSGHSEVPLCWQNIHYPSKTWHI